MEHHRDLGVTRFYIMDSNSSRPSGREVADYISSGLVDFFYRCTSVHPTRPFAFTGSIGHADQNASNQCHLMNIIIETLQLEQDLNAVLSCCSSDLTLKTRFPQLYVYDICLTRFGDYHQWMAFLDPDEFLVLQPRAAAEGLPEFLQVNGCKCCRTISLSFPNCNARKIGAACVSLKHKFWWQAYDQHGGLAVNLRIFGSSGYQTRPKGGILRNYIKCAIPGHCVHILATSYLLFT